MADSKLCTVDNLNHIDVNQGTFITLVPENCREVKEFYERLSRGETINREKAYSHPHSRKKKKTVTYSIFAESITWEGYRVIWVHFSSKESKDLNARTGRITKVEKKLYGRLQAGSYGMDSNGLNSFYSNDNNVDDFIDSIDIFESLVKAP